MKNQIMGHPIVNKIIGMKLEDASNLLADNGYSIRVINENGSPIMVPMDSKLNRVNVFIVNGHVDDIDGIG
jgi:hypothetical protein